MILLPFFLVACGGDSPVSMTYTGSTIQAEITDSNAKTVVVDGISTTSATSSANGASAGMGNKATHKALKLAKAKAFSISRDMRSAPMTFTESETGPCGGTLSFDATVDDETFEIKMAATFNNYCEDDITMSGSMLMDMSLNSSQSDYIIKMTFTNLKVNMDSESITMSGTMSSEGILSSSLVMNMIMLDNKTNEQVKYENFIVTLGANDVEYSGRIYHSVYGYVDVTTLLPMTFDSSGYMSSGSIEFAGSNSSTTLSAATNGGYLLETDIDGDGSVDVTDTGAWADLSTDALFSTF